MAILLLVLLLALVFVGLGFLVKVLWWVAIVVLAIWLLGFAFRSVDSAGTRRRWYRW
ncbi:hypothetical protein [Nocardia sp. NPDC020380]|uniref:hypothetical protein n=1 Tax=Nocardia sp. NPDC020380 TaxID=3364309 RepID=UPI00379C3C71